MSSFISNMMENFVESKTGGGSNYNQSSTVSETYNSSSSGTPQVPYPWSAEWNDRERRYIFVHQETGEQVWEYEEVIRRTRGGGYQEQQENSYYSSQTDNYGGGYAQQNRGYGGERVYESETVEERSSGGGHGMAYGALGGVAGLAAGAGLMYEGEKIHGDYEQDKYRVENDVENFPENAARWTGNTVGEVESVPQDIEYGVDRFDNRVEQRFDNAVYDVEDAPERAAGWFGNKVGDVERFDDNVDNAYDQGRYDGRNDDRW